MSRTYSIAEARDQLPRLVHEAEAGGPVQITRRGRRVAVLLSDDAYRRLTEGAPSLWRGIQELRAEYRVVGAPEPEAFEDLRDPSPGRDVDL